MSAVTAPVLSPRRARGPWVAAWLAPLMVVGQFALLSAIPIGFVVVRTYRNAHLRPLRPLALALAGSYAVAVALWIALPDRAQSLSKDLHPVTYAVLVAAGVAYAVGLVVLQRRRR